MHPSKYVIFAVDGQWCAVPLASVHRLLRAAAVTPVPDGPDGLLGVLDLHGDLVPILDLKRALRYPAKALRAPERFLIVLNSSGLVGIRADEVCRIGSLHVGRNGICELMFHRSAGPFCQVAKCEEKTVFVVNTDYLGRHG
ncbi:MAG: chemotaxis protein CheW [Desulfosoma sp.]|uniref:chemotaxis protein CheW n=1 Tax=Desulfosoma sp. TaxID=2603217 RepID=UPI00404A23F4